jgi:hypothetical protein
LAEITCDVNDFYHQTLAIFQENIAYNEAEMTADIYGASDDAAKELRHALGKYSQLEDTDEREAEHYEKGWKSYHHKMVDGHVEAVTANANAPQLTHLIEKGHELFINGHDTGRRTKPRPHIKEAFEHAKAKHFAGGDVR